jgi:hypothetical protein
MVKKRAKTKGSKARRRPSAEIFADKETRHSMDNQGFPEPKISGQTRQK